MKRIGILTSGGDAPGMNAAIRAVARKALSANLEVCGINYGYKGLVEGNIFEIKEKEVSDLIQLGGTMLYTARYPEFAEEQTQLKAIEQLKNNGIDALVTIGGDGTYHGAVKLTEHGYNAIGVPGTIDNDIPFTDHTIGFNTAIQTSVEEIDRIRDTAKSHSRIFVVEVMGRNSGEIALRTAVASGSQVVVIPEKPFDVDQIAETIKDARLRGHDHQIIVTAEGAIHAQDLTEQLSNRGVENIRGVSLGHVVRGGSPTAYDRVIAARMGSYAVELLLNGQGGQAVGIENQIITHHPIIDLFNTKAVTDLSMYELANTLSY
ncbi:6-phosphofructokinase [Xylocopilactobacillus apis]|uniref:ATP-dependent 6-phosphofructokinase n=1 Tax=Xylocopilactobacillus apis TaxID=2932183 RepID=A0AAU9DEG2_9LACO|nr:6-phosphofructokinase [Xylocopilactobacillus apis]BDR56551.1 ATP-dependent 6-phosphofructokinase [Xylocopilactobacillus apis]